MVVSEAEAKRVREAYMAGGEAAAARQLRELFPGLVDNEATRAAAVTIAGWAGVEGRTPLYAMPKRLHPRGSPPRGP